MLVINIIQTRRKRITNKQVRLRVMFILTHDEIKTTFSRIFSSNEGLAKNVQLALYYAKTHRCKIESMELITTK